MKLQNQISKNLFSFFEGPITNTSKQEKFTIIDIYEVIKSEGILKEKTEILRRCKEDKKKYSELKSMFPYATFSGLFKARNSAGLIEHSGLICLDFDHLGDKLTIVRQRINQDIQHVVMSFISPGGDGLKVVYAIDTKKMDHKNWFLQLGIYMKKLLNDETIEIDRQCKDVARACFISHDPEVFINPRLLQNPIEQIQPIEIIKILETSYESPESDADRNIALLSKMLRDHNLNYENPNSKENFLILYALTEKKHGQYCRPRKVWIHELASRCNLFGMDEDYCKEMTVKYFKNHRSSQDVSDPLSIDEHLISPVVNTYTTYKMQHASWEKWTRKKIDPPALTNDVYENLPQLITDGCLLFDDGRERDIFLLGLLTILSACMPNVKGIYDNKMVEANIYLMISASAASGKGTLKWSYNAIKEISSRLKKEYENECDDIDQSIEALSISEKPVRRSLIIPGNISISALIQSLGENENRGLVFETEADTITNTLKNDWGNYSDLLRKAFHHEPITVRRTKDNQFLEVENPCLSVLLSGTPGQITNLIGSTENGLFSRFLFYNFKGNLSWKDVFGENTKYSKFNRYMEVTLPISTEEMYSVCLRHEGITFEFTKHQQIKFNEIFESWLLEADYLLGEQSHPTVKRLGLILFRIAMILSTVRRIGESHNITNIICTDQDFYTSKNIIECLKIHAFKIMSELKKGVDKTKIFSNGQQNAYYLYLPQQFDRAEAELKAKALKLNLKTAEKYLDIFIKHGVLERPKHGHYQKTSQGLQLEEEEA